MHSPVLINYNPTYEEDDDLSDWYTDEYYDEEPAPKRKRRRRKQEDGSAGTKRKHAENNSELRKKVKLSSTKHIPNLSLADSPDRSAPQAQSPPGSSSIVHWRHRYPSRDLPTYTEQNPKPVALLKDWRTRFKSPADLLSPPLAASEPSSPTHPLDNDSVPPPTQANGSERGAFALDVQPAPKPDTEIASRADPPRTIKPSKPDHVKAPSPSATNKQSPNRTVPKAATLHAAQSENAAGEPDRTSTLSDRSSTAAGQKRKAPELVEENGKAETNDAGGAARAAREKRVKGG